MYPFAETAPEITTTTVEQVAEIAKHPKNESLDKKFPPPHTPIDHFDDAHTLGALEEESVRKLQKQHISTTLSGCTEITPTIPSTIPPNVPSDLLEIPTTQLSTLDEWSTSRVARNVWTSVVYWSIDQCRIST